MAAMKPQMGAVPQTYPTPLPASPTLTNPEMILPDYDHSSSPDLDDGSCQALSQSSLMMWSNNNAATSNVDLQQFFTGVHDFSSGPVTPTTPIIYGNGTMLSDIGEVTEVESTTGKSSPTSVRYYGGGGITVAGAGAGARGSSSPLTSRSASPSLLPHNMRDHSYNYNAIDDRDDPAATLRRTSPANEASNNSSGTISQMTVSGGGIKQRARQQQKEQQKEQQMRRDSIDSNNTIMTAQEQAGMFADFDDAASMDDSVFQGDDEESIAEPYVPESYVTVEAFPARQAAAVAASSHLTVPRQSGDSGSDIVSDDGRRHSAASLSRRAEEILANAKRRLTTMEDNLTQARSTLYVTAPLYGSFVSDRSASTPSPRTPIRVASALADSIQHGAGTHSYPTIQTRLRSGSSYTSPNSAVGAHLIPPRSASALGAAGGYRPPRYGHGQSIEQVRDSLSGGYIRAGTKPTDHALLPLSPLSPLSEDEPIDEATRAAHQARARLRLETGTTPSPTFSSYGEKILTRSASANQMRDLRHQMKDLKGKISSLREQARADSMKRKNLQGMRTQSPFTYARVDPWYSEAKAPGDEQSNEQLNGQPNGQSNEARNAAPSPGDRTNFSATPTGTNDKRELSLMDNELVVSGQEFVDASGEAYTAQFSYPQMQTPVVEVTAAEETGDDLQTETGSDEEEMVEASSTFSESEAGESQSNGYESESGESTYHDSVQHQISHEDREDAFDYEHFILHSALGTISQQRLSRRSCSSFTSEDSVETTRGPVIEIIPTEQMKRRGSISSLSTVESFATATEGRQSRTIQPVEADDEDDEDEEEMEEQLTATEGQQSRMIQPVEADDEDDEDEEEMEEQLTTTEGQQSRTIQPVEADDEDDEDEEEMEEQLTAEQERDLHKPFGGYQSTTLMTRKRGGRMSAEDMRSFQRSPATQQQARPVTSTAVKGLGHRPSVSSFESTGTMRSFPLVNRSRLFGSSGSNVWSSGSGSPTTGGPRGASTEELKSISETIMSETASICEQVGVHGGEASSLYNPRRRSLDNQENSRHAHSLSMPVASVASAGQEQTLKQLMREDQFLMERLVASLGQCVLGLTESRVKEESAIYRRRMEAARQILEGLEPV